MCGQECLCDASCFISRTATKKVLGLVKHSMYSMSIVTNDAADQCPNTVQP